MRLLRYPLSPTTRLARCFGRPRPRRLIAPCSINCSNTTASWRCPAVTTKVSNFPPPSARRWILVLKPPRLGPNASRSAPLFLPPPHVDGRAQSSHQRTVLPNPPVQPHHLFVEQRPRFDSRHPAVASGRNGSTRCHMIHSVQASRATVRQSE